MTKCVICGTDSLGVDSSREDNKEEIIVYGRNGNKTFLHRDVTLDHAGQVIFMGTTSIKG